MPFYALATRPLIDDLSTGVPDLKQIWYADDATAAGKISDLKKLWDRLEKIGSSYGYFTNPRKTWLITRDDTLCLATKIFADTDVNITTERRPVLGSPIGKSGVFTTYVATKVDEWISEIDTLSEFADSQPHAAYSALTHGLTSKWTYLSRTTPNISGLLQPLEDKITTVLLPKLTGREAPRKKERTLFTLPASLGRVNINNPALCSHEQYIASLQVTKPLVDLIISQRNDYPHEALEDQLTAKNEVQLNRRQSNEDLANQLRGSLLPSLQLAVDLSQEQLLSGMPWP